MGTYYTLNLRVGFEISEKDTIAPLLRHSEKVVCEGSPGEYHMEDRFDPKTGKKTTPVQVWTKKPTERMVSRTEWMEFDGKKYEEYEWEDPDHIQELLSAKLECNVDHRFDVTSEVESWFIFYLHKKGKSGSGYKFDIGLSELPYQEVFEMKNSLYELRNRMIKLGLPVGDPKVFIAQDAS